MKTEVSALMDEELDEAAQAQAIGALCRDPILRQEWETYCAIGDALRGLDPLPADFTRRVMDRLAGEPMIVAAPLRRRSALRHPLLTAAASVAGVALVGWFAVGVSQNEPSQPAVAVAPMVAPVAVAQPVVPVAVVKSAVAPPASEPVQASAGTEKMPPNRLAYLFAHQGYSPNFQGVAQYLRVVSETGAAK